MTYLPLDLDGNTIPVLKLKQSGAHAINISDTAARNITGFDNDTRVVSVFSTVPVYLAFGETTSVTANSSDHFFPANTYYDIAIGGEKTSHLKYLSAIAVDSSDTGSLFISEKS